MTPKITVIMPAYNRADLISKSIESVLNQTYKDFEFLILDDGSTDNTKEVVEKYLSDPRVKYLYHENQGEAQTVNWGWSLANGEYFTQVNSDDTITPDSFEKMVEAMDKHPDKVLAYPDFNFIDENDNIISVTKSPDWNFKQALSNFACYAASAGTFIRREPFKEWKTIKRGRFKHINDIEMYWDMALVGDFLHVKEVLANWRVHSGQISHDRYNSIPEIEVWYKYYFEEKNLPDEIKRLQPVVRKSILNYFISLLDNSNLTKNEKRQRKIPYLKELNLPCYEFNCLQIGDNDLIGNKFNGHDLHLYLREKNIDANHIIMMKLSHDKNTFLFLRTKSEKKFTESLIFSDLFLDADIIHLHLIHNTLFDLNYLPIITAMKPTVITLHDPYFLGGHCIYHFDCEKWKTFCKDCPNLDSPFPLKRDSSAFEFSMKKHIIQNSNITAIVASKWMENKVTQSPIWQGKTIHRLPFGINQDIFKPADKNKIRKDLNIPQDATVLMFRSDISPFKGLDLIKNALKNLKTDKKIVLLTVAQKGKLKELKNKFDIREYGWLKDDELLAKLYQASDLFLMPSTQEAFGMMAIEAMSCKVPVLALTGTALPDVINSPQCGLAVDADKFSTELQRLINTPEEIKERGEKSLTFAKENYDKEVYINKMINIYKEVIANHKTDAETEFVFEQLNKYAKNSELRKRFKLADNKLWRLFYKLTYRIYLKKRYGKKVVHEKYDKKYL